MALLLGYTIGTKCMNIEYKFKMYRLAKLDDYMHA